jgi:sporulation protein YlmC with PRC-barrel domain
MSGLTEYYDFSGRTVVDQDGEKIGTIADVYHDFADGRPAWALVHSGLFRVRKTFVPLRGAQAAGEAVRLPIAKEQARSAPRIQVIGELSAGEEQRLIAHYGIAPGPGGATAPAAEREPAAR